MCKWACAGVWKREGKKRKETRRSLDSPRCSFSARYHRGRALESDYSWIWMAVLDLEKKKTPSRTDDMEARRKGGLCRYTSLRSLRERENNTKEPRVSIKDGARPRRWIVPLYRRSEWYRGSSLLLSVNSFLLKPRSTYIYMCDLSGPEVSNLVTW